MTKKRFKPYLAFNQIAIKMKESEKAMERLCNIFANMSKDEP